MEDLVSPSTEPNTLAVRRLTIQTQEDIILFQNDLSPHSPSSKLLKQRDMSERACACAYSFCAPVYMHLPRFPEGLILYVNRPYRLWTLWPYPR